MTTVELSPDKVCDHTGRHEKISDCCSVVLTRWNEEVLICPRCGNHTIAAWICADCGDDVP